MRPVQAQLRTDLHSSVASHRACKRSNACSIDRAAASHGKRSLEELLASLTLALDKTLSTSVSGSGCASLRSSRRKKDGANRWKNLLARERMAWISEQVRRRAGAMPETANRRAAFVLVVLAL